MKQISNNDPSGCLVRGDLDGERIAGGDLLVYGPGRHRFRDFLLVGGLQTVLFSVVILVLLPLVWDL